MIFFFFLAIGFLLIVVQATWLHVLPNWFGVPNFCYVLVIFCAYRFSVFQGLLLAFILGWMMDVISGVHLGIYPLQNIIVFVVLKFLTQNTPLKEGAYQVPLVGLSYFVLQMGFFFIYSIIIPGTLPSWSWSRIVQETCILLLVSIPLFLIFNFFFNYFSKKKVVHKVMRKRPVNQFR